MFTIDEARNFAKALFPQLRDGIYSLEWLKNYQGRNTGIFLLRFKTYPQDSHERRFDQLVFIWKNKTGAVRYRLVGEIKAVDTDLIETHFHEEHGWAVVSVFPGGMTGGTGMNVSFRYIIEDFDL